MIRRTPARPDVDGIRSSLNYWVAELMAAIRKNDEARRQLCDEWIDRYNRWLNVAAQAAEGSPHAAP